MRHSFLIGSIGYPLLEIMYRGRTHPAMALAGGVAMCGLKQVYRVCKNRPLWQAALLGGFMVTGIEYLTGIMCNRDYRIWDYRRQPMQLNGQICIGFSLVWCLLSGAVIGTLRQLEKV